MEAGEAGSVMIATLANGGLEIEFNDAYGLDGDVKAAAEATAAAIADGSIATGVGCRRDRPGGTGQDDGNHEVIDERQRRSLGATGSGPHPPRRERGGQERGL